MNLLKKDLNNYLETFKNKDIDNIVFFPNYLHIETLTKNGYQVGSQDISHKEFGAITGDTSVLQLKDIGITYTLIGHSERRIYYMEKHIKEKIEISLENNIIPILCIGETEEEYNNKLTRSVLKQELDEAYNKQTNNLDRIIIAYEPIWSIGTGKIPENVEIYEIISFIKNYIFDTYQVKPLVLYGGSVNLDNINQLKMIKNLDGYLIGGASLDPKKLLKLAEKINS